MRKLVLLVSLLGGCQATPTPEAPDTGTLVPQPCPGGATTRLTLVHPDGQRVQPGEIIPLAYGPQGSGHIDLVAQVTGLMALEPLVMEIDASTPGGTLFTQSRWATLACNSDGTTTQDELLRIFPEDAGLNIAMDLQITLEDPEGRTATDVVTLFIED